LESFGTVLEASAAGFNGRGGANDSCIEIVTCDDKGTADDALVCVRELESAGVVASINDQGTAGAGEVSDAMAAAGIPRVATNVTNADWGDPNAYPIDAGGLGATFLVPQGLLEEGSKKIALVRVNLAQASALTGFLASIYEDDGLSFVADLPVAAGTTDYTQFILAAEEARADGVAMALGPQEAEQVIQAAGQMASDLRLAAGFPHSKMAELGDVADNVVMVSSLPPATSVDVPVYEALRADLAAADDPEIAPENVEGFALRGWIGLYSLLRMIRDAGMTDFSGEAITSMLQSAQDVPMLGIFGDETWTPDKDHPGVFKRAGTNHWATYRWDPEAEAPRGLEGNFVRTSEFSFDETLCGSPLGGPEPC
jgi:branched-chain amino acid transport system substrate-binding protein